MPASDILLTEPRLHKITLSFLEPEMEQEFLGAQHYLFVNTIVSYAPIVIILLFTVLVTGTLLYEPQLAVKGLNAFITCSCVGIYLHFRFKPPSILFTRFIYLPGVGVLFGLLYAVVLVGQIYAVMMISAHYVFISFLGRIRFIEALYTLNILWLGNLFIELSLSDLSSKMILAHAIYFCSFGFLCLFAIYHREYQERITFYQRCVIEQREEEIKREKAKAESLLLNILPRSIAERLKNKQQTIADAFDNVTVLFADIVGFTRLSVTVAPEKLVLMLNELFSLFDDIAENYDLEKIKTIGDAYMVAAGLPQKRDDHAIAIALMALEMLRAMSVYREKTGNQFKIRIGINSGPAVAGVIGKKKFSYDLWGDVVNTASRMESHGLPDEIQVTKETYTLLKDTFHFEHRGKIDIKGKGPMETYFLKGKIRELKQ
ncbi:adenylate/guanylate cyclase domain-containing protein [candidate division CSSED10-310 bacterium]|uniref:Adenylate/guanylate cyclase domain-containing protein n=1 Tax=candidate division CSSED10-310 bacterium TaxID=2855610 RepID=A0ABV6Z3F2_UNCC1